MAFSYSTITTLIASALMLAGCGTDAAKDVPPSINKVVDNNITDEVVSFTTDSGRTVSTRLLTPDGCQACPLIIFSHGANAAFDRYDSLLLPIAKKGYRIAAPNHTDSEDHPSRAEYTRADWLPTRLEDYNVIAAQYETNYRIAAGHSFGAMVAQIAGGAKMSSGAKTDSAYAPNVVLAYSPPGPIPGYIGSESWSQITVPSLVTTGTKDVVPMMAEEWELHLVSYESTPSGMSYALIYNDMDHYMNGAYGRETAISSVERTQALEHMINASVFYLSKLRETGELPKETWETQGEFFVEARAK